MVKRTPSDRTLFSMVTLFVCPGRRVFDMPAEGTYSSQYVVGESLAKTRVLPHSFTGEHLQLFFECSMTIICAWVEYFQSRLVGAYSHVQRSGLLHHPSSASGQ